MACPHASFPASITMVYYKKTTTRSRYSNSHKGKQRSYKKPYKATSRATTGIIPPIQLREIITRRFIARYPGSDSCSVWRLDLSDYEARYFSGLKIDLTIKCGHSSGQSWMVDLLGSPFSDVLTCEEDENTPKVKFNPYLVTLFTNMETRLRWLRCRRHSIRRNRLLILI